MTFEEIEQELPNGFHDAEIRTIAVNFVDRSIAVGMDLHFGSEGDSDPERHRSGTLKVESFCLFFIEPPDPRYRFVPNGSPLNASGDSVTTGKDPAVDGLLRNLPTGVTLYRFFLDDWNSFLYLGGANVEFSWEDEGIQAKRINKGVQRK